MSNRTAVVNGVNMAYIEQLQKGDPKVVNIIAVRGALEENREQF